MVSSAAWNYFEDILQIYSKAVKLQLKLMDWWLAKPKSPCIKEVLSFIPTAICWELWTARNQGKCDNKHISVDRMIACVKEDLIGVFRDSSIIS